MTKRFVGGYLVLLLIASLSSPALAAYPGLNGEIAIGSYVSETSTDPITHFYPDGKFPRHYGTGPDNPEYINENQFDYPVYSPSGRYIAVAMNAWVGGGYDIWIARSDDSDWKRITEHPANDVVPTWAPGERRLAFVSARSGNSQLYIVRRDGSHVRRIPEAGPDVQDISWSPSGDRIAFITPVDVVNGGYSGPSSLYTIGIDGSGLERVTDASGSSDVDWSPDGSHLAFERGHPTQRQVVTVNADGSDEVVIEQPANSPAYSPDGRWIVYTGLNDEGIDYLMRAPVGGGEPVPIRPVRADGIGIGAQPTWQPLRPSLESKVEILDLARKSGVLKVTGAIIPPHRSQRVDVTLRTTSSREVINRTSVLTGRDGTFHASIDIDQTRECLLRARFPGDYDHFADAAWVKMLC